MVLDCIASGAVWVDMLATGVDVLISAPQKSWSGPACSGLVMLSQRALQVIKESETPSSSFVLDLRKWLEIMNAYEAGGFAYHATMPTDALMVFRDAMLETQAFGFDLAKKRALELGSLAHDLLCNENKFVRVAAPGYEAPGVVVRRSETKTEL
jgi:aspartate aminotransferase-like enzyme